MTLVRMRPAETREQAQWLLLKSGDDLPQNFRAGRMTYFICPSPAFDEENCGG